MHEAIRLHPPAPTNIPCVVGKGSTVVLDAHVSEDMCVGVPKVAIIRDADAYPTPRTYKPERWVMDPAKRVSEENVE